MLNRASFTPAVVLEPTPIRLSPLAGALCPVGFPFNPAFHLIVTAGVHDVTLDSVTIHMVDGTNLGGPSIVIPRPQLADRSGSTVILAGSTRDFALNPDFGCIATTPVLLNGSAVLIDQRGTPQTIVVQGRVQ